MQCSTLLRMTVNQYFTNSDSTWWARHNQVVPLGHPGHAWVKSAGTVAFATSVIRDSDECRQCCPQYVISNAEVLAERHSTSLIATISTIGNRILI